MGEKDLNIVKQLEHDLFTANLADAMAYLAKKRTITYRDFLQVHASQEIEAPDKGILDAY